VKKISEYCVSILRKLLHQKIIGGKHTPETYCLRWIKNLQPKQRKVALKDWEWCIKEGLIVRQSKNSEKHISLNPRRLSEILKMVE
jgi:hypothetical protein